MPDASSITMRPAVLQDLDALAAIDARCFHPGIAYPKDEIAALLNAPAALTLVAERSAAIVAFIAVRFWRQRRFPHAPSHAELVTIDVLPEFRREGLGWRLHQAAEDWLRAGGCASIDLHVAVDNAGAVSFYDRLGYRVDKRVPDYYLDAVDAWQMSKPLR